MNEDLYDAIIVGGGPAGLSAALVLGRCRRRILVCDSGEPRNAASRGLHGFLSRDGTNPSELLRIAREQLSQYGVECRDVQVTDACAEEGGFRVTLTGGTEVSAKKLLLATGVVDHLPEIEGLLPLYGRSVFHCPYCDGWEMRDRAIAVYGQEKAGLALALSLKTWTDNVALCTGGPSRFRRKELAQLASHQIKLHESAIVRLEGSDGRLHRIVFENGESLERDALFFTGGQDHRSDLSIKLGCRLNSKGFVETDKWEETGVPGLYVAGDASHDVQFVVVAAAEGARAAVAINKALQHEQSFALEKK